MHKIVSAVQFPGQHETGSRLLPDECVDFGDVDVVQLLDSVLDLMLVCLDVHNEHKCVVVLNLLHGGLCCQGELDDGIVIQPTEKIHTLGQKLPESSHVSGHMPLPIVLHYKYVKWFWLGASVVYKAGIMLFHTLIAFTIICTRFNLCIYQSL